MSKMSIEKRRHDDRVEHICQVLEYYYPSPPVPLNSINEFTFLVSVILSAQTTDGKVNEVTSHLFNLASTPEQMAALDPAVVQNVIKSVGLAPQKAKNIVEMSKQLVENFQSTLPCSYEQLESLAGVGHKTASVVKSHIFNEPSFAVDTHVHRLALRWGISRESTNVLKVQNDLCSFFPRALWNKVSSAEILIFLYVY
jgi:endonuclease-3